MLYLTKCCPQTCRNLTWIHIYWVPPWRYATLYVVMSFRQLSLNYQKNVSVPTHYLRCHTFLHPVDLTASERYLSWRQVDMTLKKMAEKVHGTNIYKCLYTWNVVMLLNFSRSCFKIMPWSLRISNIVKKLRIDRIIRVIHLSSFNRRSLRRAQLSQPQSKRLIWMAVKILCLRWC